MKKPTRSLLIDESPLQVYPTLATAIGLEEAIFVQQLHWYLQYPDRVQWDNKSWVYNTYEQWCEYFPFWSEQQMQRIAVRVERMGIVQSERINKAKCDHRKFYTLNYAGMEYFRLNIDLILQSAKRSRSKEYPDYNMDDHIKTVATMLSELNNRVIDLDTFFNEQKNHSKESQKNTLTTNDKNLTENQHADENENTVDLPVLLSQTGVETEQADSPISIEETSNTQQSTVEYENSGLESDHRDHQTRNHSAPRKKSARRAVPAQSAMLPASDTIAAAEQKTRKRSVATAVKKEPEHTPEQRYRMAEYVAIFEDERNKPYVPKSSLAGRIWKEVKELLLYNPSLEDVRNMYRSYAAQPFWAGRNITPITLANNYEEWVTAKRPMNGATRYRDPANVPVQKPRQTDPNVIDASSLFWIENDKRFDLEPNDLVF